MKRTLLALTMLALFLPVARPTEAADVSIDFFYNNLEGSGQWVEVADYGYCWQPNVAVSDRSWRPYSDGYWAYTDVGWTWVSYEDFGWATYHYGRWSRLSDYGWVWVPGYEWGPAWVSWRTGGDYVGWAPLPPHRGEVVYEGRPITGRVDLEFDIGPMFYNFVDLRYIGEPVLRDRIYEPSRNVTIINRTVNVTNITYNNSTVYNYGPDYNTLSAYSTRPIQRLKLQRQANVDASVAATQAATLTKVQGDSLIVAAPQKIHRSSQVAAPKVVKTKIGQPKFENGWSGMNDPKAQAELKQKMKTEDAKNVPPPTTKPTGGTTAGQSNVVPSAGASPATPASGGSPAVAASPATPASPAIGKGKGKGRRGDQDQPAGVSGTAEAPAAGQAPGSVTTEPVAAPADRKGKGKHGEQEPAPQQAPGTDAAATAPSQAVPAAEPDKKNKGQRQQPAVTAPPPAGQQNAAGGVPAERGKHKGDRRPVEAAPTQGSAVPVAQPHGRHLGDLSSQPARAERRPVQAPPNVQPAGQERPEKGKGKKKGEQAPAPTPGG
jgi:hypothetical protein